MQAFPPEGAALLRGATLLLPVVSVGNVGQLAADLIINTCEMPRSARLEDDALLPAVGHRGYGHVEGLATAMELYQQQGDGSGGGGAVAVVQQRAAAAPGTQVAFAERLAAFLNQSGVKEVRGVGASRQMACWGLAPACLSGCLHAAAAAPAYDVLPPLLPAQVLVLGSVEATVRRDAQMSGPQLRYWAPSGADSDSSGSLAQRCAAAAGLQPLEAHFFEDRSLEQRLLPPWPLLRSLQAQGVPCAAILSFTTEGDNLGEAFEVAAAAAAAAGLPTPSGGQAAAGAAPQSWQYVYGESTAVY